MSYLGKEDLHDGGVTTFGFFTHAATINANALIPTGYNALSAGPVSVGSGVTVTMGSGSTWVVVGN